MRYKRFTAAAALAMIGLATAGCGGSQSGAEAASGSHEINLMWENHPWQRAIQPMLADFTKKTGIKVNVQTFAEAQMRDKQQLTLQSRSDSMDVYMTLPSREGPLYAKSGYYEPLDDYLAKAPADYKSDDFTKGAMAGMKIDGKTIALPLNVEGTALYYRKDIFEKYGLTPPKTLDDLQADAKAIKAKGEITPVTLRGQSSAIPFTFAPFLHSLGGSWTTPDGKPNVDTPQAIEAIKQYATLAKDYGPPGVINYTFSQSSTLMGQGKAAMEIESSNELSSILQAGGDAIEPKLGVTTFPAGPAGSKPVVLSWGLAMSPFSKHKEDAWKFMQWATSPETDLAITKDGIAPPRTSVLEDPKYVDTLDTPVKKQWYDVLKQIQTDGDTEVGPVGVKAPAMRKVAGDAIGKAILGQATPEQAAAQMQQGLAPMLAGNGG